MKLLSLRIFVNNIIIIDGILCHIEHLQFAKYVYILKHYSMILTLGGIPVPRNGHS